MTSGNWGCGAFRGNPELKFMIQWIAASLAKKKLNYCPFDRLSNKKLVEVCSELKGLKVGKVLNLLLNY